MYVYLQHSKHGYEIAVVGESQRTASYAGIKVDRVIIRTMVLSGAICGLMGFAAGRRHQPHPDHHRRGRPRLHRRHGVLDGQVQPLRYGRSPACCWWSSDRGASEMSSAFGLNHSFADILTGIILFFIIGSEFFITYKVNLRKIRRRRRRNRMFFNLLYRSIPRAVMQGIPLLYGSTGEILTEKSGNLNLGIPGIMYVGGISGVIGCASSMSRPSAAEMNGFLAVGIPLLCSLLGSLLMGLLYCFLTVTLRANQNVTGLAMTTFGVGVGNFFGGSLIKLTGSEVPSIALSSHQRCSSRLPSPAQTVPGWFGELFLSYGFLAYAGHSHRHRARPTS